ncbi:MAG TPA: universal stress protein [Solirubrobacteraceae bacterium]|jgi:nucleotide-binding universal stress UspA family protein
MFANVIVGVDGQPSGHDAIVLAAQLMDPDGQLSLANIHHYDEAISSALGTDQLTSKLHLKSMELLEHERTAASIDALLLSEPAPSTGAGLHHLIETHHADLLVIGSCRRGFIGRIFLGDDTRAALSGAACAVAVAPSGYAHSVESDQIAVIGVGYDGSAESDQALALARSLARMHGARIQALMVMGIPPSACMQPEPLGFGLTAPFASLETLDAVLDCAKEQMDALQEVEGHAVWGLAGEELAAFSGQVDLLVVGSRQYGPLQRLMLGSASKHLVRTARCPLLLAVRTDVISQSTAADEEDIIVREDLESAPL